MTPTRHQCAFRLVRNYPVDFTTVIQNFYTHMRTQGALQDTGAFALKITINAGCHTSTKAESKSYAQSAIKILI